MCTRSLLSCNFRRSIQIKLGGVKRKPDANAARNLCIPVYTSDWVGSCSTITERRMYSRARFASRELSVRGPSQGVYARLADIQIASLADAARNLCIPAYISRSYLTIDE